MSSIEHIRSTTGWTKRRWPPRDGMTLEENLGDLERHAGDFTRRAGFTFTVLEPRRPRSQPRFDAVRFLPELDTDDTEPPTWQTWRATQLQRVRSHRRARYLLASATCRALRWKHLFRTSYIAET